MNIKENPEVQEPECGNINGNNAIVLEKTKNHIIQIKN